MSDDLVRLALVGGPNDADLWQDVAMRLQGGQFTVVVDSEPQQTSAENINANFGVSSLESALEKHGNEFDAVVIRSPHLKNQVLPCLAANAGKHVMVEAPVARSLEAARETIAVCEKAGICFAVSETLRFRPANKMIMDRLAEGKLGTPGLLRIHRWCATPSDSELTLHDRLYGDVDLANWIFGTNPTEIYALGRPDSGSTPDYVQVHFGFPEGGMAVLDFSAKLPSGPGYESVSLIGSGGAAYADDHHNTHLLFGGGPPTALVSSQGNGHVLLELQAFVDAVRNDTRPPVSGDDCRSVHHVIEAVARSLESGGVLHQQEGRYVPS